ncbi:alpha/beta hydrolase [Peribacillus simplex]|uniref:lipase/acyltransferase domain-containing protein n=1 Tax=Peribacillus simplex TaxID=1478 RepID=UPI00298D6B17|nr:alpha/beta hydrolase [Peribacillus simplex]MDW7614892.1 alpha/beta hydrolase [Peribacillus simplex]
MIIFVPGIKGSELYDGDNKRWFPATQKDLDLLDLKNDLEPRSVLRHVTPFGITKFSQVIYRDLLDEFGDNNLSLFPYDWRRSIFDHVEKLANKIINESKANNEKVTLVAHSMGGMLAKLAIQKLEEKQELQRINKFITIGTPWHGAPDAFKSLTYGEPGIFEKLWVFFQTLLSAEATKNLARILPSVYQLLPSETYFNHPDGKFIVTEGEMDITYEGFKTKIQNLHDLDKNEDEFVDVWKNYIDPLHKAMTQDLPPELIHDCLIGHSIPTLYKVPEISKNGIILKLYKQPSSFMNGDGVVPLHSATPSHNANLFFTEGEHSNLCSLPQVINFIKWSEGDEDLKVLPDGITYSEKDIPVNSGLKAGLKARIMCPVESTILDEQGAYVAGVFDPSITEISKLAESDDVRFYHIGESKYIFFMNRPEEDLTFEIHAYKEGIASISLEVIDNQEETELKFDTIPVNSEKSAKLVIPASKLVEESVLKYEGKETTPKKRKLVDKDKIKEIPVPKVKINFQPAEGVKKILYRHTYSGPVFLTLESDDFEKIDELFYSIDGKSIYRYNEKSILDLAPGKHIIEVFGKDVYNRPITPVNSKIYFDTAAPKTKVSLLVEPEGIFISFKAQSNNSPSVTHYRFLNKDTAKDEIEWRTTEGDHRILVPANKLRENTKASIAIEFFSKNTEFDFKEEVQKFEFSLGNIPMLMWEEFTSALTPSMVWDNLLPLGLLDLSEFSVSQLIQNKFYDIGETDVIGDNVKSIKFQSDPLTLEVFFSEKYSLYFSGPPTELLQLGQEYEFSFELRTERGNERITSTNPTARIHAIKGKKLSDKPIELKVKNGVFKGNFTVNSNFKIFKHKLIITDTKNITPPLREIPLILSEQVQDE